jgi:hypothetical protein
VGGVGALDHGAAAVHGAGGQEEARHADSVNTVP